MTDLLQSIEYDEDGRITPKIGENLECGPNGLRYTGPLFIPNYGGAPCKWELCDQRADGSHNTVLRRDIFGEFHAPPVGCVSQNTINTLGNAGGVDLGIGSAINIDVLNGLTIDNNSCYPMRVTTYSDVTCNVVTNGVYSHFLLDLVGNGTPSGRKEEVWLSGNAETRRFNVPILGRVFNTGVIPPGQSMNFTVQLNVTNGVGASALMGVFEWSATHRLVKMSFEDMRYV